MRKKRKQIVNYQVTQYKDIVYGWLIIGRTHPLFGNKSGIVNFFSERIIEEEGSFIINTPIMGNERIHWNVVKKKFRNMNFCIICIYSYKAKKEEFTKDILSARHQLVMEYIKSKREENKND